MGAACVELAWIYYNDKKFSLAQEFYQLACNLKDQGACSSVIEAKSRLDKNFNKVIPHYKLCQQGYGKSCSLAADFLKEGKQIGEAKKLYELGCFLNETYSCNYLGWLYVEEKNENIASYYYQQGCDLGSIYGCEKLASLKITKITPKDE